MSWRRRVKQAIPPSLLNRVLLAFPALYSTNLVRFESNMTPAGHRDLFRALGETAEVAGDIIECGSSRCGTAVILVDELRRRALDRTVYCYDSFQGFDRVELERETTAGTAHTTPEAFTSTSIEYVTRKIEKLGLTGKIVPVPGFFETTLPIIRGTFAVAIIDCDLHDSMMLAARSVWPHLAPGGTMLFDDYTAAEFSGARTAIDRFVAETPDIASHGLGERLYRASKKRAS